MKLVYTGPHDRVALPLADGSAVEIERGGTVEVPVELARDLLAQADNWTPAKGKGKE